MKLHFISYESQLGMVNGQLIYYLLAHLYVIEFSNCLSSTGNSGALRNVLRATIAVMSDKIYARREQKKEEQVQHARNVPDVEVKERKKARIRTTRERERAGSIPGS